MSAPTPVAHEGHMTRSEVRSRVNASMVPGQEKQKHVIFPSQVPPHKRVWIWSHCANYKGALVLLCMWGIGVCIYALSVEFHKEADPGYEAMCDISETMSCSKVLTSEWGKGFGLLGYIIGHDHPLNLKNPFFGIVFYLLQLFLSDRKGRWAYKLQLTFAILANCGTLWLAYILYFVLNDFCVVCVTTYAINFGVLLTNIARFREMRRVERLKKE